MKTISEIMANHPEEMGRRPRFIMPIGAPGCGKSSWTAQHLAATDRECEVVSSDVLVEAHAAQRGMTYNEAVGDVDMKALERVMRIQMIAAFARKSDVIIDRTNLRTRVRNRWLSNVPKHYVKIGLVFVIDREKLFDRLRERAQATGKYVPYPVVVDMIDNYQEPTADEFDIIEVFQCSTK